jgi:sensor histidine kinase YesM
LSAFNTGVGLSNTRSRLEHLYGARHRFEFHTPPGGGLAVTIAIPFVVASTTRPPARMESVA